MAKKNTNVAEQLKKFNANIADEIVEKNVEEKPKHSIKDYSPNAKKKEILITEINLTVIILSVYIQKLKSTTNYLQ